MNFEELEKKVNKNGNISYWKDGEIVYKQCSKCKEIKKIEEFGNCSSNKDKHKSSCLICNRGKQKEYYQREKDIINEKARQYYYATIEYQKERREKYYETHKEEKREYCKKYWTENKDKIKEYRIKNKDKRREYLAKNKERIREKSREWRENNKESVNINKRKYYYNEKKENIKRIKILIKETNSILEELPIYGYIYKITNIKTNKIYIGQTINPIKRRYDGDVIKGWMKERKKHEKQKFKEELIEEDFIFTEKIAIGVCKYHLDKLEAYYIDKYDSYNNGYNNNRGLHDTDDGLEEFNQILLEHNLEFINGELRRIV